MIVGRTRGFRDSRIVIGKFKDSPRGLQDVFVAEKIRRGVKRREQEVHVFRVVESDVGSTLARAAGVGANKETYYVVSNDDRATSYLREAVVSEVGVSERETPKAPLGYTRSTLMDMISSVKRTDMRANRVRAYAKQPLERARGVLEPVKRCRAKFTAVGVDTSQIELEIEGLIETLEAAVREEWGV